MPFYLKIYTDKSLQPLIKHISVVKYKPVIVKYYCFEVLITFWFFLIYKKSGEKAKRLEFFLFLEKIILFGAKLL